MSEQDIFDSLDGVFLDWPFKKMAVNDVVALDQNEWPNAQMYCHTFARQAGMKFKTRKDRATGKLYVKRIK